ncbi:Na(+)/dicarboxylate cotransporter 3-like isoform X2 [Dermacentor albipictus]|uniref:Na(+)/dicarboxylate cotransporter 3-like isoform X2 n=1 Tax=Dermacentor albipictus TaxID=60249 RepID=UPI0031FC8E8E
MRSTIPYQACTLSCLLGLSHAPPHLRLEQPILPEDQLSTATASFGDAQKLFVASAMSRGSADQRRPCPALDGRAATRRSVPAAMPYTAKENADSVTFFGMWSPVILFPIVLIGTNESRCAYCLCLLVALLLTDALSPQVAAMLPFILFLDLPVEEHPLYFNIPAELLHQIAVVLMVASVDATSLLCRVALYAMALFGTRVRTLLCGCVAGAALCTLLMSATAAVLLMAAVADNMVQLLQNELVQAFQQRALFDQATVGLSSLRRRLLEDILWPRRFGDREPASQAVADGLRSLPSTSSSEATMRLIHKWSSSPHGRGVDRESLPKLANAKYVNSWVLDFLIDTNVTDDQLMNHEVSRASAPCSTETGEELVRRHSPPKQPVAPSKSSFLSLPRVSRRLKKTSILEDGQVVMPGQSSPERKGVKSIEPYRRPKVQQTFQRHQLQQIIAWRKDRYQTIHYQLLMGVVVASSLSSMLSRAHNSVQRNVIGYVERFRQPMMTTAIWCIVLLPAELLGIGAFWLRIKFTFLTNFDAPDNPEAQIAIQLLIQKIHKDIGLFRYAEIIPTVLLLTWVLVDSFNMLDWSAPFDFGDNRKHLEFDYLMAILAFAVPWQRWYDGRTLDFRQVARRLPWGAFFLYLSSLQLGFVIKEFGLAAWISRRVRSIQAPNRHLSQVVLTACSALLTEMTGDAATASLLMPVAVDAAIGNRCHPLYFAVPVLVASSTSMIFPVGSMALALLNSITDIGARDMMVAGLMTKATTITIMLFTVNTVGYYVFDWKEAPPWLDPAGTGTVGNLSTRLDVLSV